MVQMDLDMFYKWVFPSRLVVMGNGSRDDHYGATRNNPNGLSEQQDDPEGSGEQLLHHPSITPSPCSPRQTLATLDSKKPRLEGSWCAG
jgi:hypothetical protein